MFTDYAQNLHGHWRGQCLSPQLLKRGLHSVYTAFLQYLVLVVEDWRLSTMITTLRTIYTLSGKKKKKKKKNPAGESFGKCSIPWIDPVHFKMSDPNPLTTKRCFQESSVVKYWWCVLGRSSSSLAPAFLSPSPFKKL